MADSSLNLTNKISDLKRLSEEKKSLTVKPPTSPSRQPGTPLLERPASRMEITALERELEDKVRLILDTSAKPRTHDTFGEEFVFQPTKENMQMTKERMLTDFGASIYDIEKEPWLESYIRCECLKSMCDEVSSKFSDMLGVNSNELGNVARKLRLTYKQSFEQMALSWKALRKEFLHNGDELQGLKSQVKKLQHELAHKEDEISKRFDNELIRLNGEFNAERDRDKEKLLQAEFKMDQMADTLKYLNGIFRTMQGDGSSMKNADLQSLCARLDKENRDLKKQNADFDVVRAQLANAQVKIKQQEGAMKANEDEIHRLKLQLQRRDEVVNNLMEREALRNAEVEKLQKISKIKDDELLSLDMKDPATSVLCIKCKKSLDDMTNIRSALLGDGGSGMNMRMQCENFRILLPNLKGRKPNRTNNWLRGCVRSILISKMKEEMSMHFLRGETSRFPSFTYAWFARSTAGLAGANLTKQLMQCDEDRWGLYYGVKALSKDDPECSVFWSLLDEAFGQDGLRFVSYCLSVVLSIAGLPLLRQFGNLLSNCSSVEYKNDDDSQLRQNIWLEIGVAKEAVKLILTRALMPHVTNAIDAIDALKVTPQDLEELKPKHSAESGEEKAVDPATAAAMPVVVTHDPTHINLFMWLRVMLQQLHADQIHRAAAIRLMFETASVGALTPALPFGGSGATSGSTKGNERTTSYGATNHVEYPQFLSICQTLFPNVSVTDAANLYAICHRVGKGKVTAESFVKEADWRGLFSQAMMLQSLPLIRHLDIRRRIDAYDDDGSVPDVDPNADGLAQIETATNDVEALPHMFYNKKTKIIIRSKLATVIHRKWAGITPSIKYLMRDLPEQWRILLKEALEQVKISLDDTYLRLKQIQVDDASQSTGTASASDAAEKSLFLDGIQPYLAYRRLISLASLAKSMNENPFLPSEIFQAAHLRNSEDGIAQAISRVDKLLSNIEQSLLVPYTTASGGAAKRFVEKYMKFEHVRKVLVARRLQTCYRKFLGNEVAVPRPVRMCMAAGYLSNNRRDKNLPSVIPLKLREVYFEPWWGQGHVAGIYMYKIQYDFKASLLGLAPVPLAQAVAGYHYHYWGSSDMAERSVHDLFVCIKAYRMAVPRLRMFAAFLGDGRDIEDSIAEVLRTPQALSIYTNLLMSVHRELYRKKVKMQGQPFTGKVEVSALFPSTENYVLRVDKKDVWFVDSDILVEVAKLFTERQSAWMKSQNTHNSNFAGGGSTFTGNPIYIDLVEKLRPDSQGRVEVDDFLYITMIQWAKIVSIHVKKSITRGNLLEKSFPTTSIPDSNKDSDANGKSSRTTTQSDANAGRATSSNNNAGNNKVKLATQLSILPMTNLKGIIESVYVDSSFSTQGSGIVGSYYAGGNGMGDAQHYSAAYIKWVRTRVLPPAAVENAASNTDTGNKREKSLEGRFSFEILTMLRDCVMWDTNLSILINKDSSVPKNSTKATDGSATVTTVDLGRGNSVSNMAVGGKGGAGSELGHWMQSFQFLAATFPEVVLFTLKITFNAFQNPFNTFLSKVSR